MNTVEDVALPFEGESDIDELDVIGASTRSTTIAGDATPPDKTELKPITLVIPPRKGKRSRTPSVSRKDALLAVQKKQKVGHKKAVSGLRLIRNLAADTLGIG